MHTLRPRTRAGAAGAAVAALVLAGLAGTAPAQASDTLPWTGDSAPGAHQPRQHGYTAMSVLDWSPKTDPDAALMRARVPLQARNAADADTQKNPGLSADTQMLVLAGDYGNAFFESHQDTNEFSQYLFNFWQYTDFYGTWHGQASAGVDPDWWDPDAEWTQRWFEFGMMNLPNPAYTNAAHLNGVRSLATIFLSDNDRGEQTFTDLLVKDDDGRFPVATKLGEMAEYFGFDGYFINQEEASQTLTSAQMDDYKAFIQQMRSEGLYVQWYDSVAESGRISYQNELNDANDSWLQDPQLGRVSDSIFLNYWWNHSKLTASRDHAVELGLDPRADVFAGVEAGGYQFDQPYVLADNIGEDGQPMLGIATLGSDFVHADYASKTDDSKQWETFDRERRWWTGASGASDGSDTNDGDWQGIDTWIAERSAVSGTVFHTDFSTGHGLEYRVGGEVSSVSEWGNMNAQSLLPTWQWWITGPDGAASALDADFDYGPSATHAPRLSYTPVGAWRGGSSLVLTGELSEDSTVHLYKTDLDVTGTTTASLTWDKSSASDSSSVSLGLTLASDPRRVVEVPVPGSGESTDGWTTSDLDLSRWTGDTIEAISLVVHAPDGGTQSYQLNVGALTVTDGARTPAAPTGLTVDRLDRATRELTASWDMADYDDVKSYRLYLGDQLLDERYDSTIYVKNLPAASGELRLVAVGADGTESAPATVSLDGASGATGLTAEPQRDGTMTVAWTAPADGAGATASTTVRVETISSLSGRYATPFVLERTVEPGTTSVDLTGLPVDGSEMLVTVRVGDGDTSTLQGSFADATLETYPVCDVTWNDDGSLTLVRPSTADWRYLRVAESWTDADGAHSQLRTFAYTYSQPAGDKVIKGRTKRQAYTLTPQHAGSTFSVSVEDYAGNVTADDVSGYTPIPAAGEDCTPAVETGADTSVDGRTVLTADDAEHVADGSDAASVSVAVQDVFGNPITGQNVIISLSKGLSTADGRTGDVVVSTGSTGRADLSVVATREGEYALHAAIDGTAVLNGDGATLTFSPARPAAVAAAEASGKGEVLFGDWDGDGRSTFALRQGAKVTFWANNAVDAAPTATVNLGHGGFEAYVGDWDGDGVDTVALRQKGKVYYQVSPGSSRTTRGEVDKRARLEVRHQGGRDVLVAVR